MNDPIAAAQQSVADMRKRISHLDDNALDLMFREARTFNAWLDKPVEDDMLRRLHDLFIMGPTSGNCLPVRVIYLKSRESRERLRPALGERNIEKTLAAPMTALIANDLGFWEHLPRLFPHRETAARFRDNPALAEENDF